MAEKEMRFVKKIRGVRYVVRVKAADHARESYDSKLRKIIAEEMEQAKPTRRATKKAELVLLAGLRRMYVVGAILYRNI